MQNEACHYPAEISFDFLGNDVALMAAYVSKIQEYTSTWSLECHTLLNVWIIVCDIDGGRPK